MMFYKKLLSSSVICVPLGGCVSSKEILCLKLAGRRAETGVSLPATKFREWSLPRFFHLPSQPMKPFHCTLAVVPFKKPTWALYESCSLIRQRLFSGMSDRDISSSMSTENQRSRRFKKFLHWPSSDIHI